MQPSSSGERNHDKRAFNYGFSSVGYSTLSLEGWMEKTKKDHLFANMVWKKRYIVFDVFRHLISYYEDEEKKIMKGRVKLTYGSKLTFVEPAGSSYRRDHVFEVTGIALPESLEMDKHFNLLPGASSALVDGSSDCTLVIAASSAQECEQWFALAKESISGVPVKNTCLYGEEFVVKQPICVSYGQQSAHDGNTLAVDNVVHQPKVKFTNVAFDSNCIERKLMHTLIMLDLDWLESDVADHRQQQHKIHWFVYNIQNADVTTGQEYFPYLQPAPYFNTGSHRYTFCLFEQEGPLDIRTLNMCTKEMRSCPSFMTQMESLNIGVPVAYDGFYCHWSPLVDLFHKRNKIIPPEEFLSPSQQAEIRSEREKEQQAILEDEKRRAKEFEIMQNRLNFEAQQREAERKQKEKEKKAETDKKKRDEAFLQELERMKIEKQKAKQNGGEKVDSTHTAREDSPEPGPVSSSSMPSTTIVKDSTKIHGAHLIYEGMMIGKKFKHEIMNHSRFCWIDASTGRLHWSKVQGNKDISKSIDLKRDVTHVNVTHQTHINFHHTLGSKNTVVLEASDEPIARLWYNVAHSIRDAVKAGATSAHDDGFIHIS